MDRGNPSSRFFSSFYYFSLYVCDTCVMMMWWRLFGSSSVFDRHPSPRGAFVGCWSNSVIRNRSALAAAARPPSTSDEIIAADCYDYDYYYV